MAAAWLALGTIVVRIADGLWMVSGEEVSHPWDANAYLVGGDEPTLIDCGSTEGYPALTANLRALGYRPRDIRRIIATHGHWDHLSAAAQIQAEGGAELLIHTADRAQVESGDGDLTAAYLYGRPFPPARVDGTLRDGEVCVVNGIALRIYHTPGHSPGSVCLWGELPGMRLLIAGDTVWGGYHPRLRSDLEAWHASLARLAGLEIDVLTVGHGRPGVFFDGARRVKEARGQLGLLFNPWFKTLGTSFRY